MVDQTDLRAPSGIQSIFRQAMKISHRWIRPSIGRIICAKCLLSSMPHIEYLFDEYLIGYVQPKVLEDSCRYGASNVDLEFILLRTVPNWRKVVNSAARGGYLNVFRWMIIRQDGRGPWEEDFDDAFSEAAAHGHLDLMKWLFDHNIGSINYCVEQQAARNGHLKVLKWLHKHTKLAEGAMGGAAGNGHLGIVQWLVKNLTTPNVAYAMRIAAENGHLEVLRWMHEQECCADECTPWIMDMAVSSRHVHIVKWLFDNCSKGCSWRAPVFAAENGDVEMLVWLHQYFSETFCSRVMDRASAMGHLNVLKWLHDNRLEGCSSRAMDSAAARGHLEVVQWLHYNRDEGCTTKAMEEAAAQGHLNVVKWLYANRSEGFSASILNLAVRRGQLEVVRWLLENNLVMCPNKCMEEAAWRGHLDLAIFLGENTVQRASSWGLVPATRQGYLRAIFVLTYNTYNGGRSLDWQGHKYIYNCICKVLNQLSDHHATPVSILSREIQETIECFHACNFYSCVSIMLNEALQQGFVFIPRQFFKDLAEPVKRKYVVIAGEQRNILLMRWLLESGVALDILTAISLALGNYVEITWWLSESDRVALVCQALKKKWFKVLLWVLENTVFQVYDSRKAIHDAFKNAPRETAKWLREHGSKIPFDVNTAIQYKKFTTPS